MTLSFGTENQLEVPKTEDAFLPMWGGLGMLERDILPPRKFRAILFGSARIPETDPVYFKYRELGRAIGQNGIGGVTGGGPGLMKAFNEGIVAGWSDISESQSYSHGVCIEDINRDELPNGFLRQSYSHKLVLTRLHQFVRLGYWGIVILAEKAGYGTDLEKALFHQLLQFDQLRIPLIGIGQMWLERKEWEKKWIIDNGLADPHDGDYFQCVPEAMDALPLVLEARTHYKAAKAAAEDL